jgi:2-polyprenyl-3-methyl-5-hydroxy-6-metoxy-1,4-benzoquinol methylase
MTFKTRSHQAELLDNEDIPTEDLYQNLRELDFINRTLGGHSVVLDGIKYFINSALKTNIEISNIYKNINIYEIGSGGGDNLRAIGRFLNKKNIPHQLGGVDLKEDCIKFAKNHHSNSVKINYQIADYQLATFPDGKPHIIFNSLFCHHFREEELVKMLCWMHQNSQLGFVIADLHRHPLAYYSIKLLTQLFSKSYLVKNDAPLSVLRSFSRKEWQILLAKAGIKQYKIKWKWAFRWLILVEK